MKGIDTKGKYVIDSCGWIEYFSSGPLVSKFEKYIENVNSEQFYTPTIVLYEVYKKIKRDIDELEALKAIALIKNSTTVVNITDSVALTAADLSIRERIPMADSMIIAVARYHNAKVITSDEDFKGLKDVIFFKKN